MVVGMAGVKPLIVHRNDAHFDSFSFLYTGYAAASAAQWDIFEFKLLFLGPFEFLVPAMLCLAVLP